MGAANLINTLISNKLKQRRKFIRDFEDSPEKRQREVLDGLLRFARDTFIGMQYDFAGMQSYRDFASRVPVSSYSELEPLIERTRKGEQNILWGSKISWFAKSSGTTTSKSKYIPVTKESLSDCHFRAAKDFLSLYLSNTPDSKLFTGKSLRLGGHYQMYDFFGTSYGDLSAILIENTPLWANLYSTPNKKIALMDDWTKKLPAMVDIVCRENITSLSGVPSWMLNLSRAVLEKTGKSNLNEVWPNLELFMHGGVNFTPYKEQYEELIPSPKAKFYETYNASEGFFAAQDTNESKDMLLFLNHGVFYEFIPMSEIENNNPRALPLWEVEKDVNYAIVITTNGGLWRYLIGDTVRFTSTAPYRIRITGRTKHYINTFGEELIVENAETALKCTCEATGAVILEYTAGPVYMDKHHSGAHQWIIEFTKKPDDIATFTRVLDSELKKVNSDYEAKRYNDSTLSLPVVKVAPANLFYNWMASRGKLGGQNKVPRLANNREYLESLLQLIGNSH